MTITAGFSVRGNDTLPGGAFPSAATRDVAPRGPRLQRNRVRNGPTHAAAATKGGSICLDGSCYGLLIACLFHNFNLLIPSSFLFNEPSQLK